MIFDFYPRDLKLRQNPAGVLRVAVTISRPSSDGTSLTLNQKSAGIEIAPKAHVVDLTTPVPLPLAAGTPSPVVNPDGSYLFDPKVTGGLGPYTFTLNGELKDGITFDATTGTLSRPPL